jgi:hypothetical protein
MRSMNHGQENHSGRTSKAALLLEKNRSEKGSIPHAWEGKLPALLFHTMLAKKRRFQPLRTAARGRLNPKFFKVTHHRGNAPASENSPVRGYHVNFQ